MNDLENRRAEKRRTASRAGYIQSALSYFNAACPGRWPGKKACHQKIEEAKRPMVKARSLVKEYFSKPLKLASQKSAIPETKVCPRPFRPFNGFSDRNSRCISMGYARPKSAKAGILGQPLESLESAPPESFIQYLVTRLLRRHGWIGQNHIVVIHRLEKQVAKTDAVSGEALKDAVDLLEVAPEITNLNTLYSVVDRRYMTDRFWEEARRATLIDSGFSHQLEENRRVDRTGTYYGDTGPKGTPVPVGDRTGDLLEIPELLRRT